MNLYAYVLNDPVNRVDPFGLEGGSWTGKISWFGIGGIAGIGYFFGRLHCDSSFNIVAYVHGIMWPLGLIKQFSPGLEEIHVTDAETAEDLVGKTGTFFTYTFGIEWRTLLRKLDVVPDAGVAWVGWQIKSADAE